MTTPPNLKNLNFDDIKISLTDYLKNQSVFYGYNFEGSTIQTIIDLLSYNTYYYAFYSNMISSEIFLDSAQNINSVISLIKPLGYTIPGLKSATSSISVDSNVPPYTEFSGVFSSGTSTSFYNKEELSLEISGTITQGTLVLKSDISNAINLTNQTYMLDETKVDISTIRIYVTPLNGTEEEWTNVSRFSNNNENVFYIERDGDIFTIQFGKENTLGKSIVQTDTVTITYLRSSGTSANGINSFSSPGVVVINKTTSSGGTDGPNINSIKFAAPKIFSSQDRAVTKNDYYGLLTENAMFDTSNDFVVYGGDELYPPKYGRVFISYDTALAGAPSISDAITFLKGKNTLTIIPEYVIPKKINIAIELKIVWKDTTTPTNQSNIKNHIKVMFDTYIAGTGVALAYKFNNKFSFSEFENSVMTKYVNNIANFTFEKTEFAITINKTSNINEFSLENSISLLDSTVASVIITDDLYIITIPENSSGTVSLTTTFPDADPGVVNIDTGYFRINSVYDSPSVDVVVETKNRLISAIKYSLSKFTLNLTQ